PGAQRGETLPEVRQRSFAFPLRAIALEAKLNGIDEVLIAERFGQELDGATLHRLHRHRNVAVSRNENDRNLPVRRGKLALEIEAALTGQSHIEHQAGGTIRRIGLEEVGNGRKQLNADAERPQQPSDRGAE